MSSGLARKLRKRILGTNHATRDDHLKSLLDREIDQDDTIARHEMIMPGGGIGRRGNEYTHQVPTHLPGERARRRRGQKGDRPEARMRPLHEHHLMEDRALPWRQEGFTK